MNFHQRQPQARKIAVIGGGISGMGAAYALSRNHHVTLIEAGHRLGGHARTVLAGKSGKQPVDMGFIVFNYPNYPLMTALFEDLGVPVVKSNMSFGASVRDGKLEYGLASLGAVFAQKSNALRPKYLKMLRDIFKFNAKGMEIARGRSLTIGQFLEELGTGEWFRDYYLLPLSGAIWSTPTQHILDFPAAAMMQFFENHALLNYTGQHQWYTVDGGSIQYVQRLEERIKRDGVEVWLKTPVTSVQRNAGSVVITCQGGVVETYDEVIFATHSDDTLALLSDASEEESRLLGAIRYQPNEIVLHSDTSMMPKLKQCWSSWVYTEDEHKTSKKIELTYWMNSLQPIPEDDPLFVTLNSTRTIREDLIFEQTTMRHPVYDLAAWAAQKKLALQNGERRTWFCGSWMKHGFHEDGLSSALDVVQKIEVESALNLAAE